jgi:preprotein translocase subunit SecG
MQTVVLILHLMIAAALVGVVLLQRSEGGALGMGGGQSGFMSGRGTANLLTRTTAALAALFFVTSISLTLLAGRSGTALSPLDSAPKGPGAPVSAPATPGSAPASTTPATPATPQGGVLDSLEKGKAPLVPRSQ